MSESIYYLILNIHYTHLLEWRNARCLNALQIFWAEALLSCVLNYHFKVTYMENSLGRQTCVPLGAKSRHAYCPLENIPDPYVVSCDAPTSCASVIWPSSHLCMGRGPGRWCKKCWSCGCFWMGSKLSFIFNQKSVVFHQDPMKLWKANLLVYKWAKSPIFIILQNP
jgi:hypothetical protein